MSIGSLVELIDDNWGKRGHVGEIFPVKGPIYTVRDIEDTDTGPAIRLEEIINKEYLYQDGYGETCFLMKRFRELLPPIDVQEMVEQYELV